jgi:hypothetical protein
MIKVGVTGRGSTKTSARRMSPSSNDVVESARLLQSSDGVVVSLALSALSNTPQASLQSIGQAVHSEQNGGAAAALTSISTAWGNAVNAPAQSVGVVAAAGPSSSLLQVLEELHHLRRRLAPAPAPAHAPAPAPAPAWPPLYLAARNASSARQM